MNPIVAARELKEQEDTRASGGVSGKTRGKSGKLKHVSAMKTGNFESVPTLSDANSGGPGAGGLFVLAAGIPWLIQQNLVKINEYKKTPPDVDEKGQLQATPYRVRVGTTSKERTTIATRSEHGNDTRHADFAWEPKLLLFEGIS